MAIELKQWQKEEVRKILKAKKSGRNYEVVLVNEIKFVPQGLDDPNSLIDEMHHTIEETLEERRDLIKMLLECETKKEWLDVKW